ncbi:conserved hypothetical protein [Methanothermus fervidus DSM 2088]|uniref:UBA/THIF-type NAD/FAD binding protein n=1 Tax=Methanothermus fervidus (strain ATCC 43054 / DSM 2088 / JCM 10308 / V24 S) TaxID=523846 RepID=E3GZ35_METFV|nr:hypothetical protein [Methanothermus fervidus]ADP77567.1 conserved hypothetical protein [Methanothermus fervidus DSM 2088]
MNISELEKLKNPKGKVTIVGLGRLGIRIALNLIEVHRGGPVIIKAIDGQKISEEDFIFRMLGGKIGEYKTEFLKRLPCSKKIETMPCYVSKDNLEIIDGDVVCITIAGGNTIPITAKIIKKAHEIGAYTISTMGVFGIGEEEIKVFNIEDAPENPIVLGLRNEGIKKNHILVGTGKLIKDWEPITPYVLDRIANVITANILKLLRKKLDD